MGWRRLGEREVRRGEIRWYTFKLPDKRRPVLLLTRDEIVDHLNETIVVPVTRTIRGLATEVMLTPDDGMPVVSALNFDHVALARRDRLGAVICHFRQDRWSEVRAALLIACGFAEEVAGEHDYREQLKKAALAILAPHKAATFTAYDFRHGRLTQLAETGNLTRSASCRSQAREHHGALRSSGTARRRACTGRRRGDRLCPIDTKPR
ncbi:MAG: type II toxin-antitoxin system PemK/MazF family toxin [Deltaproteobacteria bacterium]